MLRQVLFAAVTAVTLGACWVAMPPAFASVEHVRPEPFRVYYRKWHHECWHYYGSYHCREAAHDAAWHLHCEGYLAEVR
jgi:hypothetical protein